MPMYDRVCDQCDGRKIDCYEPISTPDLECACGGTLKRALLPTRRAVVTDEIPGGVLIYNGLCNEDGSPKRYYSKSEIRRAAQQRGWTPMDNVHMPKKDSDKAANGLTTRWW